MEYNEREVKGGCGCTNHDGNCQHCNCDGQCNQCGCDCPHCPHMEDEFPVKPRGDEAKREQRRRGDNCAHRRHTGILKRAQENMPPPGNPGRGKKQEKIADLKSRIGK